MANHNIIILGGGISGLSAAYGLKEQKYLLLEEKERFGGRIVSIKDGPYQIEAGPNSMMLKSKKIWNMIQELGIEEKIQWPDPKSKIRYISKGEGMYPIGIQTLLNPLAGIAGLFRILSGGFSRRGSDENLSVYDFFVRRFGQTVTENLVVPFVSGIYAGDAKKLLVAQAFPNLHLWDGQHKSLWSGVLGTKKQPGIPKKGIVSFNGGMETLPKAIVARLNPEFLRSGITVTEVSCIDGGYRVKTSDGVYDCKKLVLTLPPKQLASVLSGPEFMDLSRALKNIYSPWLAVHHLAFPKNSTRDPRRGFGFLSTQNQGDRHILGCLWPTSSFPDKAPHDQELFTVFTGGSLYPNRQNEDEDFQKAQILKELNQVLGLMAPPLWHRRIVWPEAIPQYDKNHQHFLKTYREENWESRGLFMAGSFFGGISVPDCMESGLKTAECIINSPFVS